MKNSGHIRELSEPELLCLVGTGLSPRQLCLFLRIFSSTGGH
jgi:hypothetical protein